LLVDILFSVDRRLQMNRALPWTLSLKGSGTKSASELKWTLQTSQLCTL
jgi:hypothetical protein